MSKQQTINQSFSLSGKGLHTGLSLTIELCPAAANTGYIIQRSDVPDSKPIPALAENVVDIRRGTVLSNGTEQVSTVEHALSALYALGIDNCLLRVNGPEFPILDGSAKCYVDNILRVGITEQDAEREYLDINETFTYSDDSRGSSLILEPDAELRIDTLVSFPASIISNQYATLHHLSDYASEIASARTFVFVRDLEPLLAAGLIRGGDLDNAIVIYERQLSQEQYDRLADILKVPHMDATRLGYIMHRPLVWDNEPARHKLLDIIGDLALVGRPIRAHVIADRPGHSVNTACALAIRRHFSLIDKQS